MTSLPGWVEKLTDRCVDNGDFCGQDVINLRKALTIAWKALEYFKSQYGGHCCEDCPCQYWETNTDEAMRHIEKIGEE